MLASIATTACALLAPLLPQQPDRDPPAQQGAPRIVWQRTLEDALAAQKQTGLPLLVVVNMDGEVFNERFAGTTYKDPGFVALTRNYVCVVASPDRHNERDYDALGNRIECPRFGGCTCSEHINIEPELYRAYFDKKRHAPRHIGVSPTGKILFDRYLDQSMQTAIDAIDRHGGKAAPKHLKASDDLAELFRRRDAMARQLVERRYRKGDHSAREQLLEAAAKAKNEPLDLLRMGLNDPDARLCGLAAIALSKVGDESALIDIEDALARIDDDEIQQRLIAQLNKLAGRSARAKRLAALFEERKDLLPTPWRNEWRTTVLAEGRTGIEKELDEVESAIGKEPNDAGLRLRLAIAQAAFACTLMAEGGDGVQYWLADAQRNAGKVTSDTLQSEAKAVTAIAAWYTSDHETARRAAIEAMAKANNRRQPDSWLAAWFADVLLQVTAQNAYARIAQSEEASLVAEVSRTEQIFKLLDERGSMLENGTLAGVGLLEYAGLRAQAQRRLAALAESYPKSTKVHERWRNRLLVDLGAERMRHTYANYANKAEDKPTAQWFAGYAALVAGERHTLDGRMIEAENAYTDAIERFLDSARRNESYADSANHYAVLALGGRAHVRMSRGKPTAAARDLLQAADVRPGSLDSDDGLERKPRTLVSRVHAALVSAGKAELAAQLQPLLP